MVTRETLRAEMLRLACWLRDLADAPDVPARVRLELLERVDELRAVLPAGSELEIDQRSLFAS